MWELIKGGVFPLMQRLRFIIEDQLGMEGSSKTDRSGFEQKGEEISQLFSFVCHNEALFRHVKILIFLLLFSFHIFILIV